MWEELFWHRDLIPTLLSILINSFSPISSHFSSVLEVQLSSNSIKYPLFITFGIRARLSLAMAETRSTTVATQEALASLRTASDHHGKEIQEMRTIQEVHTRTMNEMNQQLAILVQRHNGSDQGGLPQSSTYDEPRNVNSSTMAMTRPVRLEFPRFSGEDPAS